MAQASYPEDLLYHPEHDWARIDGEDGAEARFGITWFAQDALGEVVFLDAPAPGAKLAKDEGLLKSLFRNLGVPACART